MSTHCMISRDADGLKAAANAISALQERVGEAAYAPVTSFGSESEPASELMSASGLAPSSSPCSDAASIAATMRIRNSKRDRCGHARAQRELRLTLSQRRRPIAGNATHWPTVPLSDVGLLPGTRHRNAAARSATMMAGSAALPSHGFAGARRHLRVIPRGSTTLGFEFLRESCSYRA